MKEISWLNFDPFNYVHPGKDKSWEAENLSIWEFGV